MPCAVVKPAQKLPLVAFLAGRQNASDGLRRDGRSLGEDVVKKALTALPKTGMVSFNIRAASAAGVDFVTLKSFREGLEPLMPNPGARPFTCDGSPLECRIFIVGLNPRTRLDEDFFDRYWKDDYGFLRKVFEKDYRKKKSDPSQTRRRIDHFVEAASPVPCLETNIYAVPTENESELNKLKRKDKNTTINTAILEYLVKTLRPIGIFVHTKKPVEFFQELSGCNPIPDDKPKRVEIFEQPTWLLRAPRQLYATSFDDAKMAGTKMKACVDI